MSDWEQLVDVLNSWPSLDIDAEGTFKYVLIEVAAFQEGQEEQTKLIVRGHGWAEYHADIYDKEEELVRKRGLDAQCLGGGRIQRKSGSNGGRDEIVVYGYSVGFGRADHSKTTDIIKKALPDSTVSWNNEGY